MRDPERIKKILALIEELWNKEPDLRFGQLMINLGAFPDFPFLWNMEDDKWEEWFKEQLEKQRWRKLKYEVDKSKT
jgi:hypothetical protein